MLGSNRGWLQASYQVSERIGTDLLYHLDYAWADGDSFRRVHKVEPALRRLASDEYAIEARRRRTIQRDQTSGVSSSNNRNQMAVGWKLMRRRLP